MAGQVWVASPDARCRDSACPKTLEAGLAQVTVGLGWHYREYVGEQSATDRERYAFAQGEARARAAGLWWEGGRWRRASRRRGYWRRECRAYPREASSSEG